MKRKKNQKQILMHSYWKLAKGTREVQRCHRVGNDNGGFNMQTQVLTCLVPKHHQRCGDSSYIHDITSAAVWLWCSSVSLLVGFAAFPFRTKTHLCVNCSTMTAAPGPVHRWSPGAEKKKKQMILAVVFIESSSSTTISRHWKPCWGFLWGISSFLHLLLHWTTSCGTMLIEFQSWRANMTVVSHKSSKLASWTRISGHSPSCVINVHVYGSQPCQECEWCSYYEGVRSFFLLLVLLRRCGGWRLSWLCWCARLSGRRARGRCIHKDFIRHSQANLLPLVHV